MSKSNTDFLNIQQSLKQITSPNIVSMNSPAYYKESLLIIGNGYDLARGYPTKYTDFFEYLDSKVNDAISDSLTNGTRAVSFPMIQTSYSIGDYKVAFDEFKDLLSLIHNDNLNFWYVYLKLKELTDPTWSDVETQIKSTLLDIDSNLIVNLNRRGFFNSLNLENYKNSILGFSLNCFLSNDKLVESTIYSFLLEQLKLFENLFKEYISYITLSENIHQTKEQKEFEMKSVHRLVGTKDDLDLSILNFNYTSFPKSDLKFTNQHQWNIHGAASSSNLIFGIDSTGISPDSPIYRFTKTSRLMFANLESTTPEVLSPGIDTILFIGHSLSEADYSYFQSIFDYLSIYDNSVVLYFCYNEFHENNPKVMEDYQLSIHSLLKKYGNTLDNKAHGDNLISKLLLEHRLRMLFV